MLGACTTWGIVLAICSQVTSFPLAILLLVFIGLTSSVYMAMNMTMIQLKADPRMRGRVMSIGMMSFGMMPLSAVPIGFIAQKIGTPDALMISGLMLVTFTIIFGVLNRTFRQLD